jgi:hypothetical protein
MDKEKLFEPIDNFIDGAFCAPSEGIYMDNINPATG